MNYFWKKKARKHKADALQKLEYHALALSNTGYVRNHNEDAVRFVRPANNKAKAEKGYLAIVADGMGGHASGEVASEMAVEIISRVYYETKKKPLKALKLAADMANRQIWEQSRRDKKLNGMGTTCTAVAIIGSELYVMHIGDSRGYLFKEGMLHQISDDHTYVQELLASGKITSREARNHPDGNILTKSLGTQKKSGADVFKVPHLFEKGDRLMLSSDGLHDYFDHEELAGYLGRENLKQISDELFENVYMRGAHDNFSMILVELKTKKISRNVPTKVVEVII